MEFRSGTKRTLWNEAIVNELQDEEDDDSTFSGTDVLEFGEECDDQCRIFENNYQDHDEEPTCGWDMCLFSLCDEYDRQPAGDVSYIREQYLNRERGLMPRYKGHKGRL